MYISKRVAFIIASVFTVIATLIALHNLTHSDADQRSNDFLSGIAVTLWVISAAIAGLFNLSGDD